MTNENLTNTSSTSPPEEKKNTVYSTFDNFMHSTETYVHLKFKDKIFNLFQAPN